MGNLVGIGVYRLQNSFTFTKQMSERVWREAKSWRNANDKHVFRQIKNILKILYVQGFARYVGAKNTVICAGEM